MVWSILNPEQTDDDGVEVPRKGKMDYDFTIKYECLPHWFSK